MSNSTNAKHMKSTNAAGISVAHMGLMILVMSVAFLPLHPNEVLMGLGFAAATISSIVSGIMMFGDPAYVSMRAAGGNRGEGFDSINKIPLKTALFMGGLAVATFIPLSIFSLQTAGLISVTFAFLAILMLACTNMQGLWDYATNEVTPNGGGCYSRVKSYTFTPIGFNIIRPSCAVFLAYSIVTSSAIIRIWWFAMEGIASA